MSDVRRVTPGSAFEVVVQGAPTGLVGTIGVRVVGQVSTIVARATAGIVEDPAASGIYERGMAAIAAPGHYVALWDTDPSGVAVPANTAAEDLLVTAADGDGLTAAPGTTMLVTAVNLPAGITGTCGVEVIDNEGVTAVPHTTLLINEYPIGSGLYWYQFTAPLVPGEYTAVWDNGTTIHSAQEFTVIAPSIPGTGGVGVDTGIPMPPYLSFCGVEVANAARVTSYLSNGLVPNSHYTANVGPLPSILWRARGFPESFIDPATDGAPWYDPSVPESTEFLGLIVDHLDGMDTTETRTSTPSGTYRGGGVLDAAVLTEREVKAHGWLVAQTCGGLEYGRRWLADTLGAGPTACADCDLVVRLYAPPDDGTADDRGAWTLYRVALRDLVVTDPVGCCDLREVTMTLVAGDPVLYKPQQPCVVGEVLSPASAPSSDPCIPFDEWYCGAALDPPICCVVNPPAYGTLGAIVRLDAAAEDFGGARITINTDCPIASGATAEAEVAVGPLPLGSAMIIDAARHLVTYIDPDGVAWDGVPYLVLPVETGVPWLEVGARDLSSCICVEPLAPCAGGYATLVSISTQAWAK